MMRTQSTMLAVLVCLTLMLACNRDQQLRSSTPPQQGGQPPARADSTVLTETPHPVRVTARLRDGSVIIGSLRDDSLGLQTQYVSVSLPYTLINTIDFSSSDKIAIALLTTGELLRGTLAQKSVSVESMLGTLSIPFSQTAFISFSRAVPAPDSGLAAFYPFSGNAKDVSGHNLNGTVNGPTLCPDRFGRPESAYSFDGNDSYIAIPDGMIRRDANGFTLSLWLSTSDLSKDRMILYIGAAEGEASIQLKERQVGLFVTLNGTIYVARGVLKPDTWIHIAGVYRRGKVCQLWVNGELQQETVIPDANLNHALPSHTSTIGCYAPAHLNHAHSHSLWSWKGMLDEIRIYNRALAPEEIPLLFHADR